jgi:ribonuclease HI
MMTQKIFIFSDGGARGNPGPAAIAFVATTESGVTVKAESKYIGNHTNNQAEYQALLLALKFVAQQKIPEVTCYLDSELVERQLNGKYTVKNYELKKLFAQVQILKSSFKQICFINVPRTHPMIQMADSLVNKTLDNNRHRA